MDDDRSSGTSGNRKKSSGSRPETKSGLSLTDKLSILGIVIAVISVIVGAYFGYLQVKAVSSDGGPAPAGTAAATSLTPVEAATTAAPGTVFFEDDFEDGLAKWATDEGWEIRDDGNGNHYACVTPKGQRSSFIHPETPGAWQDYIFTVRVMLVSALTEAGFVVEAHRVEQPRMLGYHFQFTEPKVSLLRFDPDARRWGLLKSNQSPVLTTGTWHTVQVELSSEGLIRLAVDEDEVIEFTDTQAFVPEGNIGLGASPKSNLCFDDVKVSAP